MDRIGGRRGGRNAGRRKRRWDERWRISRRSGGLVGDVGEDEKWSKSVSSMG